MLLTALGVVDLTLSGSLIVIVILSGYANFIAPVDIECTRIGRAGSPTIDFSELKLKLMASIVAISAIKLLEAYMDVGNVSDRDLAWQTGVLTPSSSPPFCSRSPIGSAAPGAATRRGATSPAPPDRIAAAIATASAAAWACSARDAALRR